MLAVQPKNTAISHWRAQLKAQQAALKTAFLTHKKSEKLLKNHTLIIDKLLTDIWASSHISPQVCLIAVGGYGRSELYPHSDIDLLLLLPAQFDHVLNAEIEAMISSLWDVGLHVGHSVRTLAECLEEALKDVTVQTNLLEARLIVGNPQHFATFMQQVAQLMQPAKFLADKLQEQDNRHAKFNDTAYNLEPNIKESPGGLRDLHMLLWLAQSQCLGNDWAGLVSNCILTAQETAQIKRHLNYLQTLRIYLHYLASRREDRLLFDFQEALATEFGHKTNAKKRASEQLMQRFYTSARHLSLMNEIGSKLLAEKLEKPQFKQKLKPVLNGFKMAKNGLLHAETTDVFKQHPQAILECFLLLQQQPEITDFSANLLRQLQAARAQIDADYRKNKAHQALFLNMLTEKNGVNHSMRRMNRVGILGQYIPAFGRIVGQMQHDLFHVYTVDEHILNVLANLRRFAKPELKHEFPLCSQLFATFDQPYLLYLAAIFHDIAKGRGGDHSTLGTLDAKRFCKLHGLPKADAQLVSWLVAAHLKLSHTAQKTDLSDPEVIANFAQFVGDEKRLTALYLLTVADVRGTSPNVWNAWKARLLESLYYQTLNALKMPKNVAAQLQQRKREAAEKIAKFGIQQNSIETLWRQFGEAYFTRFDSDEIAWQTRLLMPHIDSETPIVRARLSPNGDGIQVMVYSKDRQALFARICRFFDKMAYNIAQAKIFTTAHGYALDYFIILEQEVKQVSYSGLLKIIETDLTVDLQEKTRFDPIQKGRVSRQVKHMPIITEVRVALNAQVNLHQIEIITGDRPGLLNDFAQTFLHLGVELHHAKINTLGNRAEDIFLISAEAGKPLNATALTALTQSLSSL